MANIWDNTDEEEKKRLAALGSPLAGISYKQTDPQQQAVHEQRGPNTIAQTGKAILVGRAVNGGIDKTIDAGGKGIDAAKESYMQSQAPLADQSQYVAQDLENGSGDTLSGATNPSAYVEPTVGTPAAVEPIAPLAEGAAPAANAVETGVVDTAMEGIAPLAEGATAATEASTLAAGTATAGEVAAGTAAAGEAVAGGAALAAEGGALAAMGPVGWGVGAALATAYLLHATKVI